MKTKRLLSIFVCLFLLTISVFAQKLNLDTTFTPTVDGEIIQLELLSDGKMLIAGNFVNVNGVLRPRLARLNADGILDQSFDATAALAAGGGYGFIHSMQILPDGKIVLGGDLGIGSPTNYKRAVLRLNPNGSLDTTLTSIPQVTSDGVIRVNEAVQLADGKFIVCGAFALANGNAKPNLARYNSNGTFDQTFSPSMNITCLDAAAQPDGKYLIANYPTNVNGTDTYKMTRFNTDDTVDTTFNSPVGTNNLPLSFRKVEVLSDGKIVGFGNPVCQMNADGSIYRSFTNTRGSGGFAVQPNGKVLITGDGLAISYGMSPTFNRFYSDSTQDPTMRYYYLGSSSGDYAKDVAVTADGKVIAVGGFTQVNVDGGGNINRPYIVRFTPQAIPTKPKFDFDGDGKDDIALYRPSTQIWYVLKSTGGFFATQFGISTDKPVVADYDQDGKADIAVFRDGVWYWLKSSDSSLGYRIAGQAGDVPQPRSYNGRFTFTFYRPSNGKFYEQEPYDIIRQADMRGMPTQAGDIPVTADHDGDGIGDLAAFRNGNWFMMVSGVLSTRHYQFGAAGDKPVLGDFDGDLRNDYAVYRPSNGSWYIQKSTEGFYSVQWGLADDIPVPADYDGDGKVDVAVFRPSNGVWYIINSSGGYRFEQFGLNGDIPAQLLK